MNTSALSQLRSQLAEHVLVLDHLQNLARAHGDTDVDPRCSCGAALGRVVHAKVCLCGDPRSEHRAIHLGGCQHEKTVVVTVAEIDEAGQPTGRTIDRIERAVCDCGEFRSEPTAVPRREDIVAAWISHAGLPGDLVRRHMLQRLVGTYVPPELGPPGPAIAHCLCGQHLLADGEDATDPAAAIAAWAEHVQGEAR